MAWIESHQEIGDHFKTHDLSLQLKCAVPTAVGYVHLLWHYTLSVSWESGDLSKFPISAISRACWFEGDPKELIKALQVSGFLDGMKVHDWHVYAKEIIYQRMYNKKRKESNSCKKAVNTAHLQRETSATIPNHTIPNHKSINNTASPSCLKCNDSKVIKEGGFEYECTCVGEG